MLWAIAILVVLASDVARGCDPRRGCGRFPSVQFPFTVDPNCDEEYFLECEQAVLRLNISGESFPVVDLFLSYVLIAPSSSPSPQPSDCQNTTCSYGQCQFRAIGSVDPVDHSQLVCYNKSLLVHVFQGDACRPPWEFQNISCVPSNGLNSSNDDPGNSRRKNTGAIVGGAVGGGAGLLLLLGCVCCVARQRRRAVTQRGWILGGDDQPKPPPPQFLSKSGRILYSNNSTSYGSSGGSSVSVGSDGGKSGTRFSYRELQEATDNFSEDGRLGDGGFGTVYKGKLRDGRLVAVKKLNPWNAQGKYQFDNEVNILSRVTHPHLVRLYGCCIEQELLLVYEFVAHGTLADHLYDNPGCYLPWDARLTVAVQCAEALAFLHTSVCYHRDVKSTNILLDERYHCKVGDFGLSRLVPSLELTHITTAPQGTPGYLDPDYHQSYQLTDKSDVYSLGVVLMELVSSQRAVDMARERKEINLAALAVSRIQCGELDKLVDPRLGTGGDSVRQRMVESVAELGFECLAAEKEDRPSMKEVAARLRGIEEEGKRRYLEQMAVVRGVDQVVDHHGGGPVAGDDEKKHTRSSPTSVQMQWPSNSTSPNDSSSSM